MTIYTTYLFIDYNSVGLAFGLVPAVPTVVSLHSALCCFILDLMLSCPGVACIWALPAFVLGTASVITYPFSACICVRYIGVSH